MHLLWSTWESLVELSRLTTRSSYLFVNLANKQFWYSPTYTFVYVRVLWSSWKQSCEKSSCNHQFNSSTILQNTELLFYFKCCHWCANFHMTIWCANFHMTIWCANFHMTIWCAKFHMTFSLFFNSLSYDLMHVQLNKC